MSGTKETIDTSAGLQLAIWKHTVSEIALMYNVSTASLGYRIHHEEIIKPPPEYLEKIERGLSHDKALVEIGWTKPMIKKINTILLKARNQMK